MSAPRSATSSIPLLESFVPASRAEPGCIEYHFHVSDEDPNIFYFYENWTDRAALDVHLNLPYQKAWFARHDEFLARDGRAALLQHAQRLRQVKPPSEG